MNQSLNSQVAAYYHAEFRADVASFMRGLPVPYFAADWDRGCRALERVPAPSRPPFLFCLYFTVLVDQAMHQHFHDFYARFEGLTRYPKFSHGIGQVNLKPIRILSEPIRLGLVRAVDVDAQLEPGMKLFVAEVDSFLRQHLSSIPTTEFFDVLASDRDVRASDPSGKAGKSEVHALAYRAYAALRDELKRCGLASDT